MNRPVVLVVLFAPALAFGACGETLPATVDPIDGGDDGSTADATVVNDAGSEAACSTVACAEVVGNVGAPGTRILVVGDVTYVIRGTAEAARLVRIRASSPGEAEVIQDEQVFGNVIADSYGAGVYWGALGGVRFVAHDAGADAASIVTTDPNVTGLAFSSAVSLSYATFGPRAVAPSDGGAIRTCMTSGLYPHICTSGGETYTSYASDIIYPRIIPAPEVIMAWPNDDAGGPAVIVSRVPVSEAGALTAPRWFAADDKAVYVAAAEGLFRVTVSPLPPTMDSLLPTTPGARINAVATTENAHLVLARGGSLETCAVTSGFCQPLVVVTIKDDTINDVAVTTGHYYWVTQKGVVYRLKR